MVPDQCKSWLFSFFSLFLVLRREIKRREKGGEKQESSALETLFVSLLNYYVTCKRSRGVGLAHGSRWKCSNQCAAWATMVPIRNIDRSTFPFLPLPLETLEFRLPRKMHHESRSSCLDQTSNLGSVARRKRTTMIWPFYDTRHGRADLICRSFLSVTFPSRI